MIGLPEAAVAAVHDPLVVSLAVLLLGGLLTHVLFRRHPLSRATLRVMFLVVLTIVLLHTGVVPTNRRPEPAYRSRTRPTPC